MASKVNSVNALRVVAGLVVSFEKQIKNLKNMGKLILHLEKQLKTEFKQDAEDCIKIYNRLKEITGSVWKSQWDVLVETIFKGFPSDERRYKPTAIGYDLLKGIECKQS